MMNAVILESDLTCPRCGFACRQTMPTDACQFYQGSIQKTEFKAR